MQMLCSRTIPFLDSHSLSPGEAREVLFRNEDNAFVLYLSDGAPSSGSEERIIFLETREALIWLNEPSQDQGSFWR
jgi:hypothetical protein